MEPLSVNEAIENLASLSGRDVAITGLLTFEFENSLARPLAEGGAARRDQIFDPDQQGHWRAAV